jgi:hypothetical protein
MTTTRDWEFGDRPTCNACGCELDPETDTHHDGYRGSPHAHNGRGSYGLSSKHYVFSVLCECCRESRTAPLCLILDYTLNLKRERLECGHTHATPFNRFGGIRQGERRRCDKCSENQPPDFELTEADAAEIFRYKTAAEKRKKWMRSVREENAEYRARQLHQQRAPVYDNDEH